MDDKRFYTLRLAGLTRQLPICPVNEKLDIAAFVMFSDVEITMAAAKLLIEKCPEHDVIVTAESKGIPLAYEMARTLGIKYFVARKSVKCYMADPISVSVKSITTKETQTLYLCAADLLYMKGKRILIVDDVISAGGSLRALEALVKKAEGNIVGRAAVLAEGDAANSENIIYLEKLPLFYK